jgi:hypothetical protein
MGVLWLISGAFRVARYQRAPYDRFSAPFDERQYRDLSWPKMG